MATIRIHRGVGRRWIVRCRACPPHRMGYPAVVRVDLDGTVGISDWPLALKVGAAHLEWHRWQNEGWRTPEWEIWYSRHYQSDAERAACGPSPIGVG